MFSILVSRNWKIYRLAEFLPRNKSLLGRNWNKGELIEIRLRSVKEHVFLPFEAIVGTLLHEMVHNQISRHGKKFNSLLNEITLECESICLNEQLRVSRVVDCGAGHVIGGDRKAMDSYTKRQLALYVIFSRFLYLCRFAAETRMLLAHKEPTTCTTSDAEDVECIILD